MCFDLLLQNYVAAFGIFSDLREEWFQSHDPMGFIGVDRNANTAAANMHIPLSMFVQPQAPPYYAVSVCVCVCVCVRARACVCEHIRMCKSFLPAHNMDLE